MPYAERRQRIHHCVHDGGRSSDGAGLPASLDAEPVGAAWKVVRQAALKGGKIACARQRVVHQRAREDLPGLRVEQRVLEQRLPDALGYAAMHLSQRQARIEQAAVIVEDDVTIELHLAGLGVDLDFGNVAAVGKGVAVAQVRGLVCKAGRDVVAPRLIRGARHLFEADFLPGRGHAQLASFVANRLHTGLQQACGKAPCILDDAFDRHQQRGAALTPAGRALYDQLLNEAREDLGEFPNEANAQRYADLLEQRFEAFPDSYPAMRREGLAYFRYFVTEAGKAARRDETAPRSLDALIEAGHVHFEPLVYEDFLPVSAAGIFQSNLGDDAQVSYDATSNQQAFHAALGATVHDELALYAETQRRSLAECAKALGLESLG